MTINLSLGIEVHFVVLSSLVTEFQGLKLYQDQKQPNYSVRVTLNYQLDRDFNIL